MNRLVYIFIIALVGCDSFPGPVLRSEFPADVQVSIFYDDGTTHSELWPSCRTVSIGAVAPGKFGLKAKAVSVEKITIEVGDRVVHSFEKEHIDKLLEKAENEEGHPIWAFDSSGIRFTTERSCSLEAE